MTLQGRVKHFRRVLMVVWVFVLSASAAAWSEGDGSISGFQERFRVDHARICAFGSRFAGQPGTQATADFLENEMKAAGVERVFRQPLAVGLPVTDTCTLQVGEEPTVRIYPVWPNGANLSTTCREGITAEAVYAGTGELDALPVSALPGRIAVLEFNSYDHWRYAAMYGAVAVVFLPPEETTWAESNAKYSYTSVPLPRFYLDDPILADRLRHSAGLSLTLKSRVRWERRTVHNVLGFIPGSDPSRREVVTILQSRYDACSVTPDLAFGAEQAINPAMALQLARTFAKSPPPYSVLVAFVCGDTFELAGSRRLMRTLTDTQVNLAVGVEKHQRELEKLRRYADSLRSGDPGEAVTGWDNREFRNDHVIWQTKMQIVDLMVELKRLRLSGDDRQREKELNGRRIQLQTLQRQLRHDDLRPEDQSLLRELLPAIESRLSRLIRERQQRLEREHVDLAMMEATGLGQGTTGDYARGILYCSLELSSHGHRFAPFAQSYMSSKLVQKQLSRYGGVLQEIAAGLAVSEEVRATYLSDATEGRRHWQSDLPFPVVNGIDAAVGGGCLGMMFATTQDMRPWVDTPLDTLDHVDFDQLLPQVAMCSALLDGALRKPISIVGSRMPRRFWKWEGMAAVRSPGEGQLELGLPDVVVYARNYDVSVSAGVRGIGVRDMSVMLTDGEGCYAANDVLDELIRQEAPIRPEVYKFDAEGRVVMAMDRSGPWQKPITGHDRKQDRINLRGCMFKCEQMALFGLYDARYLEDLDQIRVVEAARGSEIQSCFWVADDGLASVCVPSDVARWQLVFAKGDAQRRLLMLNASPNDPEGTGFSLAWRQREPIGLIAARDFACLNDYRIRRLEATGVVDPYLREQHEASRANFDRAEKARANNQAGDAWREAMSALTIQAQVYQKTRQAADDTIHAVLFLLVGLVPFCYFVERLLIAATNIYRQIGWFALLFVLMTALVGTFHPAFRISLTPVTILLAFLILFLSTLVVAIVIGKFRRELQRLGKEGLEGMPASSGDEAADGGVATADTSASDFKRFDVIHRAMLLGVANMRRRKVRTGLTLATLVLLSFVIMSFTNPRTHLHPLHYEMGEDSSVHADRHAVMLHRMSWNPLPTWSLDHLRTAYGDRADVFGHWWITRNDIKTQYDKSLKIGGSGERYALLSALCCIDPVEAKLMRLEDFAGTPALERFGGSDDAVLISSSLAERLGVGVGDPVNLFGATFVVAGVMAHRDMLSLTGLDGRTYAPVDYLSMARLDPEKLQEKVDAMEAAESAADVTTAVGAVAYRHVSPEKFVIIRSSRASALDATLRAVLFVPRDSSQVMALADELAGRIHRPIYANAGRRIVLCAATEVTSLSGLGNVVVPLFISALIIFNTMLNCVYERQREIGILMSVGLAPAHVGALFMAEVAAYGTIGVVGGYILGQALGTVVSEFDLIPGMSLNFSSSAAVYTQLGIMAVALLSAIWPAWKAATIAAPGSETSWKLPVPQGDQMDVSLPFTMHGRDAQPVLAYLREWLSMHTESSLGDFCTGAVEMFSDRESRGRGFVAQVWLAPFDLGIMQTVQLEIRPGEDPRIHEVTIALRREAGPHSAWVRGNARFLTELRKQFLLWRSVPSKQRDAYGEMAAPLFESA